MSIAALARTTVVTITEESDLVAAARVMRENHVGLLVVTGSAGDAGKPIGVLTDRDVVIAVVARESDARQLRVGDVMTRAPLTIARTASVGEALQRMREMGLRRMPVTDAAGRLVGLVTLDDLIDHLAGLLADVAGAIRNEQRVERTVRP